MSGFPSFGPVLMASDSYGMFVPSAYEILTAQGSAPLYSPFLYGDNLYRVVQRQVDLGDDNFDDRISMLKSTDRGATWGPIDDDHAPSRHGWSGGCDWDGAHTVTVCYVGWETPESESSGLWFQDFDLSAGTWGAPYGNEGAPGDFATGDGTVFALHLRAGSRLVIYSSYGEAGRTISAATYSDGTWGEPFQMDANVPGQTVWSPATVYDSVNGIVHCFLVTSETETESPALLYQQIVDGALGAFHLFSSDEVRFWWASQNPIIVNNFLLFGVSVGTGTPAIVVGTPLATPEFSVMPSPGIDDFGQSYNSVYLFYDEPNATIYALYGQGD